MENVIEMNDQKILEAINHFNWRLDEAKRKYHKTPSWNDAMLKHYDRTVSLYQNFLEALHLEMYNRRIQETK